MFTDQNTCISPICLKTASYEKYIMDETANPCTNFYQFACGGYASIYTPNPLVVGILCPFSILLFPPQMQVRGQPMLNQVIKPFGGWYVLEDNWDASTFDLHKQLKIVHVTFWTPALYALRLSTDTTDWTKKVLEVP
ncbi:unnamed protein product, partial [Candidula unifasciata]